MKFVTNGEVHTLAAIVMGLESEEIDSFVLIVRGECPNCSNRDAISIAATSGSTQDQVRSLITEGLMCILAPEEQ